MSSNDFNRELARRIAGAFNHTTLSEGDLSDFASCDEPEVLIDARCMVDGLRALGWIICPPLPGITTEGAPLRAPHPNNPCLCVVCRNRENIASGVTCAEVKIGGTCSD